MATTESRSACAEALKRAKGRTGSARGAACAPATFGTSAPATPSTTASAPAERAERSAREEVRAKGKGSVLAKGRKRAPGSQTGVKT